MIEHVDPRELVAGVFQATPLWKALNCFQPEVVFDRQSKLTIASLEIELLWLLTDAAPEQRLYVTAQGWIDTALARQERLLQLRQDASPDIAQFITRRLAWNEWDLREARQRRADAEEPLIRWARHWLTMERPDYLEAIYPDMAALLKDPIPPDDRAALLQAASLMR